MRVFVFSFTLCVFFGGHVTAKASSELDSALYIADSLFAARKYTQSFQIYDDILNVNKKASPAMLLRMSFIKEGLGNYTDALYYLNLYYLKTADRKVLSKMEELAANKGLYGYDFSDWEFIQTIFYKYFYYLLSVLLALAFLLLATMYYQKFRKKEQPVVAGVCMVLVLGLLFYTLNYGKVYHKSLIKDNNTFVMSGPSAGADVVAIIEKGHRVHVGKKQDVWTKVDWKGKDGYVKSAKLKPIAF